MLYGSICILIQLHSWDKNLVYDIASMSNDIYQRWHMTYYVTKYAVMCVYWKVFAAAVAIYKDLFNMHIETYEWRRRVFVQYAKLHDLGWGLLLLWLLFWGNNKVPSYFIGFTQHPTISYINTDIVYFLK